MNRYLDFEVGIEKLENQIKELDITKNNFKEEKEKLLEKKKQPT